MPELDRKKLSLVKIEGTYGTDSAPVVGTDAMLARAIDLRSLLVDTVDRSLLRGYMGGSDQIPVGEGAELELEIEAAGAGTSAVTVPKFAALMRACGLAGTVNSTTSYDYSPVSAGHESVTAYTYLDGVLHKLLGARGNLVFNGNAKEIPTLRFALTGLYGGVSDATPGAASFTGWQTPIGARNTLVPTITLHGVTKVQAPIRSFSVDLGNDVRRRDLIGGTSVLIFDRQTTGRIVAELPRVAVKDWHATVMAGTTGSLTATYGTTPFNIFEVVGSRVQCVDPQFDVDDGVIMLSMGLRFLPTNGNDEIIFRTK